MPSVARANLVDLVEEDDAVILHRLDGFLRQLLGIEQLVGFLVDQDFVGFVDVHAPRLGAAAAQLAENVADRDGADLRARHAGNFEQRHAAGGLHFDLDFLVIELAGAQLAAERFLGRRAGIGANQRIEDAALSGLLGAGLDVLALSVPRQGDGDLDQIAHDLLDVAADIADLGELGRFHLEERRPGELGKPASDFRLADAGRPDHQNVLRQHLFAQSVIELQPAPAIAQRNGDRALGVGLSDDEAVELGDDFARGKVTHASRTIWIAYHQKRVAIGRAHRPLSAKAGLFISPDGPRVSGAGIGQHLWRAGLEQVVDKRANQSGTVTAIDHVLFADELIDPARAAWQSSEAVIWPRRRIVTLQIRKRILVELDNELIHRRVVQVFAQKVPAHQCELLVGVAPPLRHMRLCQPASHAWKVGSGHTPKRNGSKRNGPKRIRL